MSDGGRTQGAIEPTVVRRRWLVLGAFTLLFVLSALILPDLRFEMGLNRVLEGSDNELDRVHAFYDEMPPRIVHASVVLTFPEPIGRPQLEHVARVVDGLDADETISVVVSLPTVKLVDDRATIPIPRRFPSTIGDDRTVREAAWSHPLLRRTLLSEDGRSTVVQVAAQSDDTADIDELIERVEDLTPRLAGDDVEVRVLGGAVIDRALRERMVEDLIRIIGLEILLFAFLLPILFRTARGSLLPLLVVVGAVVLNFGWMSLLGLPFAIIDIAIPGLIVIIGLCDAIHMIHRFEEEYATGAERRQAISTMVSKVGRACFYTSFTTAVGFLSLLATDHATVQAFGVKAAASVGLTFVVVVTLIPAGLAVWPIKRPVAARHVRVGWLGYARPGLTTMITVAIVLLAGLGISKVNVNSYLLEEFPEDDPVTRDVTWFQEAFGGFLRQEARVTGKLDDPEAFAALERLQEGMLAEDGVSRVESYTMWVREVLGNPDGPLSAARIRSAVTRLKLVDGAFPRNLLHPDLDQARIVFLTRDIGAQRTLALRARMVELSHDLKKNITLDPVGYTFMATEAVQLVVDSMVKSLGISFLVIALFICVIFRSVKIGLISLAPNVLPLFAALGLSGWAGIDLRIGSALIYCLGLGLAVDNTIHLVTRYLQESQARPHASSRETLLAALHSSGKALITTSLVLAVGTMCHLIGSFQSIRHVGILLFTVIVTALAADLWLLPHLLQRARVK
ncbi:MAG: MMPL family transporter, partial [Planctomycetes bacterium]|nr:MMPL family transporter [Planctomycetota bacterium]